MKLRLGINEDLILYGIKQDITVETMSNPALLYQGSSGSGKSYALKRTMAWLEHDLECNHENGCVYLLDFKGDDTFIPMHGCLHYFSYMDCIQGLNEYYDIMKSRQEGNPSREFAFLVFDEYASFLDSLPDKKTENDVKAKISSLVLSCSVASTWGYYSGSKLAIVLRLRK